MVYLSPMKIKSQGFFVLFVVGILFFGAGSLFYVGSFVLANELEDKKEDLEDLQKKKEAYEKLVDLKLNQATLLNSQISLLERQADKLEGTIKENTGKLEETKQKIERLAIEIKEKEKEITYQKEILAEFVRSYYDWNAGKIQNTLFFKETQNPLSLGDQFGQIQEKVSETVKKIESVQKSISRDYEILSNSRTEMETLNIKLEQQTVYLEGAKKQKETLYTKTSQEKDRYERKLSQVEEEIRDIEQEIENLEAEKSDNIDMSKLPSKGGAGMGYPVSKVEITQKYGKTNFTRWYNFHNGVDFGVSTGTNILAAAKGKVVATGNCGRYAYGKWVAIDHGNGLVTLYGHLSKQKVSKGEAVERGDVIGLSGNTGYSTGPHLHFSVFTSGSFEVVDSTKVSGVKIPTGAHVNPMKYLL